MASDGSATEGPDAVHELTCYVVLSVIRSVAGGVQ